MTVLTTAAVRPQDRFAYWREVISQHFVHLRPELAGEVPFSGGEIRARRIGGLSISQVASAGQRVFRTKSEIARSPMPLYFVNIQLEGSGSFRQNGEEVPLTSGDIFLVDPLREFELGRERPFRDLSLKLPRAWLDMRLARPDVIAGAVIRRDHPLARILASYLLNGFEAAEGLAPASAAIIGEHTADLVAEALRDTRARAPEPAQARREALFVRACRIIALKSGDPALAPGRIARELGISERLLQMIFAEHGETVMKRVLEERVSRASKLLAAPDAAHRSITDIAFACGFSDSSHFGRVFAARMGMTPTQWRRR